MAATIVDVRELPARLNELLSLSAAGTEIVITDGETPRARLIPLPYGGPRVAGLHLGSMTATGDFDAPLADDFWLGNR